MDEDDQDIIGSQGEEDGAEGKETEMEEEEEEKLDPEYESNISRVKFTPAKVEYIISSQKGSILAEDGPIVPLSTESEEKIRKVFEASVQEGSKSLPIDQFANVLKESGITYADEKYVTKAVNSLVDAKLQDEEMNIDDFCLFASTFQNPAYQYGQRLRRNAGRGIVNEVETILARGCNPNTADGEGLTTLHYASEFNKLDVVIALRDVAGDRLLINPKCKYGWTPLHCAAHHGNLDIVNILIEMQADVAMEDRVGKTALHMAAGQGRIDICQALLDAGADINACDKHGCTPVHEAAYKGYIKCFNKLCEASGVDLEIVDKLKNMPEDYLKGSMFVEQPPPTPEAKEPEIEETKAESKDSESKNGDEDDSADEKGSGDAGDEDEVVAKEE